MSESEAQIYGLRDPDNAHYFYVGSTKHSLRHRLKGHIETLRNNPNLRFVSAMRRVRPERVVIKTLEIVSRDIRFQREAWWIARLLAEGHSLTNLVHSPHRCAFTKPPRLTSIHLSDRQLNTLSNLVSRYADAVRGTSL
jgi:hypothetical protein